MGNKKLTRRITKKEKEDILKLGVSKNIFFHSSSKGKTTIIAKFPTHFEVSVIMLILTYLKKFKVDDEIFIYRTAVCINSFIHVGCIPLLELYISKLLNRSITFKHLIKGFRSLVEYFGFHNNHNIMTLVLDKFSDMGIPYDFLEKFLINEQKIDTISILHKLDSLENQWDKFWQYRTVRNCIFCKLDLTKLTPVTRRLESISEMVCCKLVTCTPCYQNFVMTKFPQCPMCNSFIEFSYNNGPKIDNDSDNLHFTLDRNFHRTHQNIPFRVIPERRLAIPDFWPQPGSQEFGSYLVENKSQIMTNYRFREFREPIPST